MKYKRNSFINLTIVIILILFTACSREPEKSTAPEANKPYEAVMAYSIFENMPKDIQIVEDEINKITIPKINVKVKLMPIIAANYRQQINLMLSEDEKIDLLAVYSDNFTEYVYKGYILPLNNLINIYGKDIKKVVDNDYLRAGTINGRLYGITTTMDPRSSFGVMVRKDLLDKYKIDISKVKSLNDFERVLKLMKAYEPDLPLIVPAASWTSMLAGAAGNADVLGDGIGVLLNYEKDLTVTNFYETKQYADLLHKMRQWNEAGYIMKDAAINREGNTDLFKANKAFATMTTIYPGLSETNSRTAGIDLITISFTESIISTKDVQEIQWGIAKSSQDTEKAMQLLNLLYSNQDINNLLSWGVEGKHYVKTSTEGVIDYPKGVDISNTGYSLNIYWQFPNPYPQYVWKGWNPNFYNERKEASKNAVKSKALGFTFNPIPVKTELAAVSNIINQYVIPLESGTVNPDKVLPEFILKLKEAGIDKIIAEKQRQLNLWAKANYIN
ncbi:ABC transporter substrate-binding protein [Clostridium sp. SYSU_GA19001]|uniref:ABC transporter substrate-binding protein n=1 Tax=Clostridium caldaquaticum TaxID=2940653 RepID=UPI0020770BDD|nr:ABC transporter substrate-binding protein [Clostridium caldaquaticum]MCM8710331.1 ABC transporter substrate-binding protein [Clostridium caldaquaticum]